MALIFKFIQLIKVRISKLPKKILREVEALGLSVSSIMCLTSKVEEADPATFSRLSGFN